MGEDDSFRDLRRTPRVPAKLDVGFRLLSEAEVEDLVGVDTLPDAGADVPLQAGHTENLSQGGMSLTGELAGMEQHVAKGTKLWLSFGIGDGGHSIRAMAVAAWSIEGSGQKRKFTAGLMFLGISSEDLDRIGRYVEARKAG